MKRKHVVTSFLQYKGRILILRRSKKVGSFRGNWAGVSGYLEEGEDSLERALREIREEVGLTDREVELVQRGEPLEVPDREKRILWIVHPFLFKTRRREIQMDWEHVEHRW
nr:NUDIX domain-containing protein [Nitrososphaeria archaeon]NIQ34116.1 NUDIX domain-containing protein [Nitrososphaeria archaeon]